MMSSMLRQSTRTITNAIRIRNAVSIHSTYGCSQQKVMILGKRLTLPAISSAFHTNTFSWKKRFDPEEQDMIRTKHMMKELESIEKHTDLLIRNEKLQEAQEFIENEIESRMQYKNPNNTMIAYLLVHLAKFHENFTMNLNLSEEAYIKAQQLLTDQPLIIFSYACLLLKLYDEAIDNANNDADMQNASDIYEIMLQQLRRVIELDPNLVEARHKLATILIDYEFENDQSLEEAESLLRSCVADGYLPSFPLLAEYLFFKSEDRNSPLKKEAMSLINQFIQSSNESNETMDENYVQIVEGYRTKGRFLSELQEFEEAEKVYELITEKYDINDISGHISLALAREQLKKYEKAIADLLSVYHNIKHVRDVDIEDEREVALRHMLQFTLARLYDTVDQPKKSEYLLQDLISRYERLDYFIALARSIARQNRKEEARTLLDSVITNHPEFKSDISQFYSTIENIPIIANAKTDQ